MLISRADSSEPALVLHGLPRTCLSAVDCDPMRHLAYCCIECHIGLIGHQVDQVGQLGEFGVPPMRDSEWSTPALGRFGGECSHSAECRLGLQQQGRCGGMRLCVVGS